MISFLSSVVCVHIYTYFTLNHSKMLEFWGLKGMKIVSYCTTQNWFSGLCGDSVLFFLFKEASAV